MTPPFTLTPDANRPRIFANWIATTDPAPAAAVAAELVRVEQGNISHVTPDESGRYLLSVPGSWGCRVVFGRPRDSLHSALGTLMVRFRPAVLARLRCDRAFRHAWLREGIQSVVDGELDAARAILRLHVNGAAGWEVMQEAVCVPAKSLMRMLGPGGNPRAANLLQLLSRLQALERVHFRVEPSISARRRATRSLA